MAHLPAAARALFDAPNFAHVATLLPDGSPHSVPVWVGLEGDRIAFFTFPHTRKARNLERDPRVAISVTDLRRPYAMAQVRGRVAERLEGDAALPIVDRIAAKYGDEPYPERTESIVYLVEPERVRTADYS